MSHTDCPAPTSLSDQRTLWNPVLFRRIDEIRWGDRPHVATRLERTMKEAGLQFVVETLLIFHWDGFYTLMRSTTASGTRIVQCTRERHYHEEGISTHRIHEFGDTCYKQLHAVLDELDIDPDMDLTDFPWSTLRA